MRPVRRLALTLSVVLCIAAATSPPPSAGEQRDVPPELLTRAEASAFTATSSYDETMGFLRRLAARRPEIRVTLFGTSGAGRPMPVVIVSADFAFNPAAARMTGKPVVMIQSGIHAGEIDGKDASLMILRDIAMGEHRDLLDKVILLFVPIFNVDGHERVSPHNRPNQNGPEAGMGFRTTADGHDLNRDHIKLATPEARALIGLFNAWRPALHVDNHVTDGSDHDWVLTYAWAEAPQAPAPVDRWQRDHMPAVLAATERAGHRVGPYVSLLDRSDPSKGFDSWVGGGRYSTGYFALRNRPAILVENHAYKPYRQRVLANRDFLLALFGEIAAAPEALLDAVRQADAATVKLGGGDAPPSDLVLGYQAAPSTETIDWPVYEWTSVPSKALGVPIVRYQRGSVREMNVPWVHRAEPILVVPRPRGYLVLPGWPEIEERLYAHGLQVAELKQGQTIEVETLRLSNPRQDRRSSPSYQGLTQIAVDVERSIERREFPAGTLWVPADQPDFEVAAQLLEPEGPDSLVSWGLLSIVLERKEYIDPGVLEDRVVEMLRDPETAEAWKRALRDEEFAADSWARWIWWYRRTEHWDETVGLMPVMRLLEAPRFSSRRWAGPATSQFGRVVVGAPGGARVE